MDKDLKKIVKALKAQGYETEMTRKGHLMVYRDGHLVAVLPGNVGDWRALKNAIAALRRVGFRWPP